MQDGVNEVMMHIVGMTSGAPTVTHVIPGDTVVTGVTSLGDDVFVVRYNRPKVEVYDAVAFKLQRRLPVSGLGRSFGLAACASNKCLYASDYSHDLIHRLDLSGSNEVTQWSVGSSPAGLTVNDKNVLVVIQDERKLQQFTTHGRLLRTIQLQLRIELPGQAIQLSRGQFVISHVGIQHRVCLVDGKGAVVRSFEGTPGSGLSEMNEHTGLAVDEHGNILVADALNNRLLVLDRSLTSAREMSVSVDGGLDRPSSLWYDKSHGRLYLGEWDGCRLIIIDHLKHFATSET